MKKTRDERVRRIIAKCKAENTELEMKPYVSGVLAILIK